MVELDKGNEEEKGVLREFFAFSRWLGSKGGLPLFILFMGCRREALGDEKLVLKHITLYELFAASPGIHLILGLFAFLVLLFSFHLLLLTRKKRVLPPGLCQGILDDLASNNLESVKKRVEEREEIFAQIVRAGFSSLRRSPDAMRAAMEVAGRRAFGPMEQTLAHIHVLESLAPMLGFLGTVFGLFKLFAILGVEHLKEGSRMMLMSSAIAEAMGTTIAGFLVGILGMTFSHFLTLRLRRLAEEVALASEEVILTWSELES